MGAATFQLQVFIQSKTELSASDRNLGSRETEAERNLSLLSYAEKSNVRSRMRTVWPVWMGTAASRCPMTLTVIWSRQMIHSPDVHHVNAP